MLSFSTQHFKAIQITAGLCLGLATAGAHAQYYVERRIDPRPWHLNSGRLLDASNQVYRGPLNVPYGSVNRSAPNAYNRYPFNQNLGGIRFDTRLDPYRIPGAYGPIPGIINRNPRFDDPSETLGYKLEQQRYRANLGIREGVPYQSQMGNAPYQNLMQDNRVINSIRQEVGQRTIYYNNPGARRPQYQTQSIQPWSPQQQPLNSRIRNEPIDNAIRINPLTGPIYPEQYYYQRVSNSALALEAERIRDRVYANPQSTASERADADRVLNEARRLPGASTRLLNSIKK